MSEPEHLTWECFRHFVHLDHSNAAVHMAPVRFSPITFRLAEHLAPLLDTNYLAPQNHVLLQEVVSHLGAYEEDKGR
jgi:hypothetical protein